jgi:hypothetical protein
MKSGVPVANETHIEHLSLNEIGWDITGVQELHQTLGYSVLRTNPMKTQKQQLQEVKKGRKHVPFQQNVV